MLELKFTAKFKRTTKDQKSRVKTLQSLRKFLRGKDE